MTRLILAIAIFITAFNTPAKAQSLRWHHGHFTDQERRWREHDYYDNRHYRRHSGDDGDYDGGCDCGDQN